MNCPLIGECIDCNFFVYFCVSLCCVLCVGLFFKMCCFRCFDTASFQPNVCCVFDCRVIILVCIFTAINRNYDAGCVLFKVINRYISETIKRFLNCKNPVCLRVYFIIIIIRSNNNGAC